MTTIKESPATPTGKLSLAEVLAVFTRGATQSLRFTAYDGSTAGSEMWTVLPLSCTLN